MTSLRSIADWRPKTPFYYGWLILAVSALGTYAATGSAQLVLGGIQNFIFEDMGSPLTIRSSDSRRVDPTVVLANEFD